MNPRSLAALAREASPILVTRGGVGDSGPAGDSGGGASLARIVHGDRNLRRPNTVARDRLGGYAVSDTRIEGRP